MRTRAILLAVLSTAAGAGAAQADRGGGALVVPVVGEGGAAVYCTRNRTPSMAAPMDGGGYRVTPPAPGRYTVRLTLPDERIDVLALVPDDGEVFVPPVVAHGRCLGIEVVARAAPTEIAADGDAASDAGALGAMWSLRYGRSYMPNQGRTAQGFRRPTPAGQKAIAEIGRQARLRGYAPR